MQRADQYRQPLLPNIDWRIALWQSYLNVVNSFQGLETESEMRSAGGTSISTMTSRVSMERFMYNLGVLDGQLEEDKQESAKNGFDFKKEFGDYSPAEEAFEPFKYWRGLVKLMRTMGFFKSAGYEGHL